MDIIKNHIANLIHDIVREIEVRKIDVVTLCDNLAIDPDQFIELINNPVNNVSLYIQILEEVRNERD